MTLLRNGAVEPDGYTDVSGEDAIPAAGDIIVSLQQWQEHREQLVTWPYSLGIVLRSHEKPDQIADDLAHFDVIALDFPRFQDGRAYSHARLLRERLGFEGELRAVGNVLLEQLHFMHRVGFNAFVIDSDDAAREWEIATSDMSVWYQPTADGRTPVMQLRHRKGESGTR